MTFLIERHHWLAWRVSGPGSRVLAYCWTLRGAKRWCHRMARQKGAGHARG